VLVEGVGNEVELEVADREQTEDGSL